MYELILIFHVIIAAALIGFVLLQQGKGGGMGTAFGSGMSDAFGATTTANFLSRTTAILATLFFVTSLSLSYLASYRAKQERREAMPIVPVEQEVPAPATDIPLPAQNVTE